MPKRQTPMTALRNFLSEECGGSYLEYVLIAALAIAVGALVLMALHKVTLRSV